MARWPDLPAPDDAFAGFVESRSANGAELATDDLLLAFHALRGHAAAIAHLRELLEPLRAPLRRTGADAAAIDELLADLPADLVAPRDGAEPRLAGYSGRGPLAAWLRVVAVRTLVDRRRRTSADASSDDAIAELAAPELDPELALLRRTYAAEFTAAFAAAVAALDVSDRLLLRQHHIDGLGIDRLAALHGIHRATAARRLAAARDALFDAVRRRLLRELHVSGQTLDSILRLVRSELDLTLDRYL